ncbi:expressed unknown protein [Seminavis robusta]|uniref:Uncharacterized protein n=1 Tax=Seminavis robusta TaxID=568900 RepID=A0A9N8HNY5_9STRA|nr:expressed unknown protein [Seminavis robusta]|eukprot:Sro1036_g234010.1 n/a (153) ;mRNA; r:6803-7261
MKLIAVLETNQIEVPRQDVREALAASPDTYLAAQQQVMKPQLIFGVQYVLDHIPKDELVVRMGWAASGHRMLGAPILGLFVLTSNQLLFVRQDPSTKQPVLQEYPLSGISKVSQSGWPLGLRKLHFTANGEEHTLERVHKDNASYIEQELSK